MFRKFLGATAIITMTSALVPAHAAGVSCGGKDQASAEQKVEWMADGPARYAAERHIAAAQDALLNNNMRDCAMHLSMAMQAASQPQAPYEATAPYPGTTARG